MHTIARVFVAGLVVAGLVGGGVSAHAAELPVGGGGLPQICTMYPSADAYVDQQDPNTNFATAATLAVSPKDKFGPPATGKKKKRTFIRYDIGTTATPGTTVCAETGQPLPAGSTILDAYLNLFMENAPSTDRTNNLRMVTPKPAQSWDEFTVTWANKPKTKANGQIAAQTGTTDNTRVAWQVTAHVQEFWGGARFVSGAKLNNGWAIVDAAEKNNTDGAEYTSTDTASASRFPRLSILYTAP